MKPQKRADMLLSLLPSRSPTRWKSSAFVYGSYLPHTSLQDQKKNVSIYSKSTGAGLPNRSHVHVIKAFFRSMCTQEIKVTLGMDFGLCRVGILKKNKR